MQIREVSVLYKKSDIPLERGELLRGSDQVVKAFRSQALEPVELFRVLFLDGKNRMLFFEDVARGILTSCLVHPREVFFTAVKLRCAGILTIHNHPSGDPTPSSEDREITRRLRKSGKILGIKFLDHIIIAEDSYYSFADQGCLEGGGS